MAGIRLWITLGWISASQAGWGLRDLDAIVFGRGPGSFTGLRTACAVAQGLAYDSRSAAHPHGLPVLAVDTLLALAEQARAAHAAEGLPAPAHIVALLDARMDEAYVSVYALDGTALRETEPPRLEVPDSSRWFDVIKVAITGEMDEADLLKAARRGSTLRSISDRPRASGRAPIDVSILDQ